MYDAYTSAKLGDLASLGSVLQHNGACIISIARNREPGSEAAQQMINRTLGSFRIPSARVLHQGNQDHHIVGLAPMMLLVVLISN